MVYARAAGPPSDVGEAHYDAGVKGDWVEVVVDVGDGVRSYEIVATRAGRRVEVNTSRTNVEVAEVTRTGRPIRTARFMATRVVAVVEHPSEEPEPGEPRAGRRRRGENPDQAALGL